MKLIVLACMVALTTLATERPRAVCPPPDGKCPNKMICINAATGAIFGDTRFSRYDAVQVWIYDLNPVSFSYRFTGDESVVGSSVASDFITQLGLDPSAAAKAATTTQAATKAAAKTLNKPKIIANAAAESRDALGDLFATSPVSPTQANLEKALALQDEAVRATSELAAIVQSLKSPTVGRAGIYAAWDDMNQMLGSGSAAFPLVPNPADFAASIQALRDVVAGANVQDPSLNDTITGLGQTLTAYRTTYADLVRLDVQLKTLFPTPDSRAAFEQCSRISRDIMNGRTVDVKLQRAELDSSGRPGTLTTLAEETVQMGSQIFTVSAGMAASPMRKTEYSSFTGTVLDKTGQPVSPATTGTIVGVQSDSRRLLPMALLNADIFDVCPTCKIPFSVNLSAGFTAKWDDQGTDLEMLLGPSLGFLDNHLFLTTGAYAGRQQTLQNNLYVGAALPSTTVPLTKNYRWGLGFAVSWKIK